MNRNAMVFLGLSAVSGALVTGSALGGCQGNATGTTTGIGGSSSATTGTLTTSSAGPGGSGSGGSGSGGSIPAVVVTVQQITDSNAAGHVGAKTPVEVDGVVVMSHKFLISQSKTTGSCLWGLFVSAPGLTETAPNTGLLLASYGTQAVIADGGTKAFCPVLGLTPAGDALPDDVKIGDVLNVTGKTDYFIIKTCGMNPGEASVPQYQISNVVSAVKPTTGPTTATPPTPHTLTDAEIAQLASGNDTAFHDKWGGVKVRLQNVTSVAQQTDAGPGVITDTFGHIVLEGSNLQVGDKIYYQGLLKSMGQICHSGPVYADTTTTFTQIDGFSYLDFCTWGLLPDNRCSDLTPPSDDCMATVCP
jgi:hypothetical protein